MSGTGDVSLELYLSLVRFLLSVLWRKGHREADIFPIFLNCLHHFQFLVSPFFWNKILFYLKINQNYPDLRFLLDVKVLTQQAKGAGALVTYCSGESSANITN